MSTSRNSYNIFRIQKENHPVELVMAIVTKIIKIIWIFSIFNQHALDHDNMLNNFKQCPKIHTFRLMFYVGF